MASIKRSQLNQLHAHIEHWENKYYHTEYLLREEMYANELWRDRTWTAEQEIHDLKEQFDHNDDLHNEALAYWNNRTQQAEVALSERNSQHEYLLGENEALRAMYTELLALQTLTIVNKLNNVPEELNPPVCLKPKDALEWNAWTFYSTPMPGPTVTGAYNEPPKYVPLKITKFVDGLYTNKAQNGLNAYNSIKPSFMKKHFSRIAISLLLLAVLGLGFVSYRQNEVIQYQRAIIRRAITYVLQNCPTGPAVENNSLSTAQK